MYLLSELYVNLVLLIDGIFGDNCHRLLDKNFEKQLMLKVNKKFVKDIDLSKFI